MSKRKNKYKKMKKRKNKNNKIIRIKIINKIINK